MRVFQTLKYARVLLASGWCQLAEARDDGAQPVEPWDVRAVSWSLPGALAAVANDAGEDGTATAELAATALALALKFPTDGLQAWNDESRRTKRQVLDACDRAIELAPQLIETHLAQGSNEAGS